MLDLSAEDLEYYKEINSPGLKLHYYQGFVTHMVNKNPLYASSVSLITDIMEANEEEGGKE